MLKYVHHSTRAEVREQLWPPVLSSEERQVIARLCGRLPYPLSHLASPAPPLPPFCLLLFKCFIRDCNFLFHTFSMILFKFLLMKPGIYT